MKLWTISICIALAGCGQPAGNASNGANAMPQGAANESASLDHPAWLVGQWAREDRIGDCGSASSATTFFPDGRFAAGPEFGSWRVDRDRLMITTVERGVETTRAISFLRQGDQVLLQVGDRHKLVRCDSATAREINVNSSGYNEPIDAPIPGNMSLSSDGGADQRLRQQRMERQRGIDAERRADEIERRADQMDGIDTSPDGI